MNSSRTTPHETVVNKLVWDIEYKETFRAAISENIAYVNDLSCKLDRSNALDSIRNFLNFCIIKRLRFLIKYFVPKIGAMTKLTIHGLMKNVRVHESNSKMLETDLIDTKQI